MPFWTTNPTLRGAWSGSVRISCWRTPTPVARRDALAAVDFYVHADLFINPMAEPADIVLPVTSPFEKEGLEIGFEVSPAAESRGQLRHPVAQPRAKLDRT